MNRRRALFAIAIVVLLGAYGLFASPPISARDPSVVAEPSLPRSRVRPVRASSSLAPVSLSTARVTETDESPDGPRAREALAAAERERMARDRALYRELAAKPSRSAFDEHMLRTLAEGNRYPPTNQTFSSPGNDPVVRRRAPERRAASSADGRVSLALWTNANQVDVGAPVDVFAAITGTTTLPSLTLIQNGAGAIAELSFAREGDGTFVAHVDAAALGGASLPEGIYKAQAVANGVSATTMFVVRPAYARLTGNYQDRLVDGDLVVGVEVEAYQGGRFHVLATLYALDGTPCGTAEVTESLDTGTSVVPLTFHGLLLHDSGHDGPYRLAHVSVALQSFPILSGVEADPDFVTQPYPLGALRDTPYNDLEAAD